MTGAIELGRDADILVTRENPLDDLSVLREPLHVMARGVMADRLRVRRNAELDRELDWIMDQPAKR